MTLDRDRILQSAQKYIDRKKYDRAIEEYQRIIREEPEDARTLLKIGDLQARMQAYGAAIATYDQVGQYYAKHGFAPKAIAVYKQIRELMRKHAPDLADKYAHITPRLAEIYMQQGLTSDALAAYDELATRLQRNGRERDAIKVFTRMVEVEPTNPLYQLRFAEACAHLQRLDEAIAAFWQAAQILIQLQRHDDALKVLERILHFRQDAQYARVAAGLYLQKGDKESGLLALARLQLCFQADPKDLNTLGLLAHAFTQIEQPEKAIEVYKEMARIAREQEQRDLFDQLVRHLSVIAPNDEQVRALLEGDVDVTAEVTEDDDVIDLDDEVEFVEEDDERRGSVPPGRTRRSTRPKARVSEAPPSVTVSSEPAPSAAVFSEAPPSAAPYSAPAPSSAVPSGAVRGSAAPSEPALAYDELSDHEIEIRARKAIADAESFSKLRLHAKAAETLRIALDLNPRSVEVRQKLRQVLLDAGDTEGVLTETLTLAALFLDENDLQSAESLIHEALAQDSENAVALELLDHLSELTARGRSEPPETTALRRQVPGAAAPRGRWPSGTSLDAIDDPFLLRDSLRPSDAPLPQFPFSAIEDPSLAGLAARTGSSPPAPAASERPQAAAHEPSSVESVLEEAEFFASRGLFQDARAILNEQLTRTPNHRLVLERLQEVDQEMADAGVSGSERPVSVPTAASQGFDAASSLHALEELGLAPESLRAEASPFVTGDQEVDVDQVFERFKEGVRAQVDDSDSSTHYDLGVAYKEMGLLPDAIREFELAANDPARECMCSAMTGMMHAELNQLNEAVRAYVRGLSATKKTAEQELSLSYDLAAVYERLGNLEDALHYYQKAARHDPDYRDVQARIAALTPKPAAEKHVISDEDEFDRVFDELFNTK